VELVRHFHAPLTEWIREAETGPPRLLGEKCPECGGELQERYSATGRFAGCESYPRCSYTRDIDLGIPRPELPTVEGETCPECSKPLVVKQGPRGPFIGCEGYPECRYTRNVEAEGETRPKATPTEIPCEQCSKPLVIRHGRRGAFLGCSGFPACRFSRNLTAEEAAAHGIEGAQTGAAAPAETPDVKCPECGADMAVRRSGRGPFLGCSRYPACRGTARLDGTAAGGAARPAAEPTGENCPECSKPLVVRSGRRGKFVGCTGYPRCRYAKNVGE
jgi:DNA topoisomerase-1